MALGQHQTAVGLGWLSLALSLPRGAGTLAGAHRHKSDIKTGKIQKLVGSVVLSKNILL